MRDITPSDIATMLVGGLGHNGTLEELEIESRDIKIQIDGTCLQVQSNHIIYSPFATGVCIYVCMYDNRLISRVLKGARIFVCMHCAMCAVVGLLHQAKWCPVFLMQNTLLCACVPSVGMGGCSKQTDSKCGGSSLEGEYIYQEDCY